jgi:hypothetical protein
MARRIKRPQTNPASLAAHAGEAIEITAADRLNVYWGLDGRIPVETGSQPEMVVPWAEKHAPDLLVSDEQALRAAEQRHARDRRHEARRNHTNNNT